MNLIISPDSQELIGDQQINNPQIASHPMLVLLVRSLFTFCKMNQPEVTNDVVKQSMDAISSLFANSNELKKSIFDLIH